MKSTTWRFKGFGAEGPGDRGENGGAGGRAAGHGAQGTGDRQQGARIDLNSVLSEISQKGQIGPNRVALLVVARASRCSHSELRYTEDKLRVTESIFLASFGGLLLAVRTPVCPIASRRMIIYIYIYTHI